MADPHLRRDYNVKLIEVLTGFKFIGEQIKLFEQTGSNNYVFGLEESLRLPGRNPRERQGCRCGGYVSSEAAAWCKKHGLTLWDQMLALYENTDILKRICTPLP